MADEAEDQPVLETLAAMTLASVDRSLLDPQSFALARLAALVAVDAPAMSYLMNLEAAGAFGVSAEQVQGVLVAVAPVVGTARILSAATHITEALGIELGLAELAEETDIES
jgi:alkylhydroperoxidase/carboxymuconolactone decarboxylase family protein YurZ